MDLLQDPTAAAPSSRTYVVGEDEDRLANAARDLGLERGRASMQPVRDAVSKLFVDSLAVRMHSVGAIGLDERIDNSGTLHYVSVRRRGSTRKTQYGTLSSLFHGGTAAAAAAAAAAVPFEQEYIEGEEEEEEEEIIEDVIEGGSLSAAVFGIVKGTVGPAILYLPHGFQNSGYGVAIPAMLFATSMYIFNSHRLLECWKVESEKNHRMAARIEEIRSLLQGNTNEQESFTPILLTYPELARRALGPYSFLVNLGIALMQFGVCLTYLIFVPQNLQECTLAVTGKKLPKMVFLAVMLLIEIPLSWITDIRKLTPTNVIATMLIAYGLCSVLVLAFDIGLSSDSDGEVVFEQNLATLPRWTDSWFIFIGTSFFMMEGSITLLVPLQEAVFLQEDKAKFPSVNQTVTSWIVVFYIFFSMMCVSAFGNGIRTAMTASLKGTLATTVQLAYSIAVILTFPLQAFPAMQVASRAILGEQQQQQQQPPSASNQKDFRKMTTTTTTVTNSRTVLATLLVLLLGLVAVCAIDYLGNVVSILGSLFGIPLALVFPPLMHNSLIKESSATAKLLNYGVIGIGFLAMGAASFATIVSWDKGAEGG